MFCIIYLLTVIYKEYKMGNFLNNFLNNSKIRLPIILAIISFFLVILYIIFTKDFLNFDVILFYFVSNIIPLYFLNKDNFEAAELDYIIPSISSVFVILYILFSIFK